MEKNKVKEIIISIVQKICNREIEINKDVFSFNVKMTSRELAYIFLEIEKEFSIDIPMLVYKYNQHTIDQLITCVYEIINT